MLGRIPGGPSTDRCPRERQRDAILDCIARLPQHDPTTGETKNPGPTSRSHCRRIVAVARSGSPDLQPGIDIELADPRRDWAGILAAYGVRAAAIAPARLGAAIWSFGEACYKATGKVPAPVLLDHAATCIQAQGDRGTLVRWPGPRPLLAYGRAVPGEPGFMMFVVVIKADCTAPDFAFDIDLSIDAGLVAPEGTDAPSIRVSSAGWNR